MRTGFSLFSLGMLFALTAAAATTPVAPTHRSRAVPAGEAASARYMLEVRLRKLHLVRPDLIPYPIETEVYC